MSKNIAVLLTFVSAFALLSAGSALADYDLTTTSTASPFLLVLGTGTTSSMGGAFTPAAGWTTTSLAITSADAPGLAINDTGIGVGVVRDLPNSSLQYTIWDGANWTSSASLASGVYTRTRPGICSTGFSTIMAFQGGDYKYYYAEYSSSVWEPVAEPVGTGVSQSFGPIGPDIAFAGGAPTIAFINGANNHASARSRVLGVWSTTDDVGGSTNVNISPSLVALSSGPELLMVYVNSGGQVVFSTRSAGVWAVPATISNMFTNKRVALAPMVDGGALLAYQGQDGRLYWSVYTGGAWSTARAFSSPNVGTATTPALAQGIGTATAELVFISNTDYKAYHSRLIGGEWTAPLMITSTVVDNVAVASFPAKPAYDVTISNAPSANGSWSDGSSDVWTPSSTGSNVAVSDIKARESAGVSVIISTNFGAGTESGDISVNDPLSLNAVTLTVMPAHAVSITSTLTLSGTAVLMVE